MDNEQPILVCGLAANLKDYVERPDTSVGVCVGCDREIIWHTVDMEKNPQLVTATKMCLDCALATAQAVPAEETVTAAPKGAREDWIAEGKSGEDFDRIHDMLDKAFKLRFKK